jgi:hypothetical protein
LVAAGVSGGPFDAGGRDVIFARACNQLTVIELPLTVSTIRRPLRRCPSAVNGVTLATVAVRGDAPIARVAAQNVTPPSATSAATRRRITTVVELNPLLSRRLRQRAERHSEARARAEATVALAILGLPLGVVGLGYRELLGSWIVFKNRPGAATPLGNGVRYKCQRVAAQQDDGAAYGGDRWCPRPEVRVQVWVQPPRKHDHQDAETAPEHEADDVNRDRLWIEASTVRPLLTKTMSSPKTSPNPNRGPVKRGPH